MEKKNAKEYERVNVTVVEGLGGDVVCGTSNWAEWDPNSTSAKSIFNL